MAILRLQNFGGQIPMLGDRALPDGFAVESVNTWFYGGEMRGIRVQLQLPITPALNANTRKVLRLPKRTTGGNPAYPAAVPPPAFLGDSKYVELQHPDTDIVASAMINDTFERWYFCSPTQGAFFNTRSRLLETPTNGFYQLGFIGPGDTSIQVAYTPTLAIAGGSGTIMETRAYVYTWVNEFGEESGPSAPVSGNGLSNATWTVGNIKDPPSHPVTPPAPGAIGLPQWKEKRLYRTIVSGSGFVNYYKVDVVPLGTLSWPDSKLTGVVVNNLPLESTSWVPPPAGLQGFIAMSNGFLVGFKDKDLYFSEPYHYHAWPFEYKYTCEHRIVGLGRLDQTCVVATEGFPYSVTGIKPATMAFNKANTNEPCLCRGSIVSTPYNVLYSSPNGLMALGPQGFVNATKELITRTKWIQDYTPAQLRAVRYMGGYLALRDIPEPNLGADERSIFFFDQSNMKVALTEMQDFETTTNLMNDVYSGEVLMLNEGAGFNEIWRWDPVSNVPDEDKWKPVRWKSKEFQFQYKENFSAYCIYWDDERFTETDDCEGIMPPTEHVHFKVWADRKLIYDETVPVNGQAVRLPSGFKSDVWQFEVKSRAPVYSVHVASTVKELKSV